MRQRKLEQCANSMQAGAYHLDGHPRLPAARASTGRECILKVGGGVDAPEHFLDGLFVRHVRDRRAELVPDRAAAPSSTEYAKRQPLRRARRRCSSESVS